MGAKLILAGQRSGGKAAVLNTPLSLVIIVAGLLMCILGFVIDGPTARQIFGSEGELVTMFFLIFGGIMLILGIATPFLSAYQSKKCYIDVYETYVSGAYLVRQKGSVDQYVPFQLSYGEIRNVSASKNKVYLHTVSGTIQCFAFNADKICLEIQKRLSTLP